MTTTVPIRPQVTRNSYCLPEPGADLERALRRLWPDGRPAVPLYCGRVPLVAVADPAAEAAFEEALGEATDRTAGESVPRARRGQPKRNVYVAAEVAYMLDVEGRLPFTEPANVTAALLPEPSRDTVRGYLDPALAITRDEGWRSITLRRWRDDGRRVLAAVGGWPWALAPDGRLERSWYRDPRYLAALRGTRVVPRATSD